MAEQLKLNGLELLDKKVIAELIRNLGIKPSLSGYDYIKDAVAKCYADATYKYNITKRLYVDIAKAFDTTPTRVERAMRHAIEQAWGLGSIGLQEKVFGYTVSPNKGKPTNTEFIAAAVEYLHETHDYVEVH